MRPRLIVCAHRGASLELPDNSIEAFVAAIASGCELIETDVRLAPDGRLVLAHDTWEAEHDDVVDLDALIDLARGHVGLDLEIAELGLERAMLEALDGFPGKVIVTSTLPEALQEVARLADHMATGLVIEAPFDGDPLALTESCGAYATLVEDELLDRDLLDRAARLGRELWVWTINDAARLREVIGEPAITGVITDDPALACHLRDAAGVSATNL
jgi:glycerophosphoryl diester phosphodiesterase